MVEHEVPGASATLSWNSLAARTPAMGIRYFAALSSVPRLPPGPACAFLKHPGDHQGDGYLPVLCGVFADCRLFAHASLDLHLFFSSVRGRGGEFGGWGGGDDVHANAACVFCFCCCINYFSNAAGCSVKPLLPLLVASLLKRQPCKNLEFFKTKTSQLTLKINKKQRRKTWYLRHFRKNFTNKSTKNYLKTYSPKHRLVDENHTTCCCSSSSSSRCRSRSRCRSSESE